MLLAVSTYHSSKASMPLEVECGCEWVRPITHLKYRYIFGIENDIEFQEIQLIQKSLSFIRDAVNKYLIVDLT